MTAVAVIVVVAVVPVVVGDGSDALGAEGSIWSMFWVAGHGHGDRINTVEQASNSWLTSTANRMVLSTALSDERCASALICTCAFASKASLSCCSSS